MAVVLPVGRSPRPIGDCPGAADLGWWVCIGHRATGCVGVLSGVDRLRVVVAEPLSETCPRGLRQRVVGLTGELLAAGAGLEESADALMRHADEDRRTAPQAGLTLVDLLPDGQALVSCRYAPSAVHVSAGGLRLRPSLPGTGDAATRLTVGDHLLAYSGTFLEAVPPGVLADLQHLSGPRGPADPAGVADPADVADLALPADPADLAGLAVADLAGRRAAFDTCDLWRALAAGCDPLGPPPDLAVITRTG